MTQLQMLNNKQNRGHGFLLIPIYLTIILLNLLWTATYTGDLNLAWALILLISPIVGGIIWLGVVSLFSAIFKIFKVKLKKKGFLLLGLYFSLILSVFLGYEEAKFGIIWNTYRKHIYKANKVEMNKDVHEIALGSGKILYFESEGKSYRLNLDTTYCESKDDQDIFELNFEYQGRKRITRAQIVELAKDYCFRQNYEIGTINQLELSRPYYKKTGFLIRKSPGEVIIYMKIKGKGPEYGKPTQSNLTLKLIYVDNQLKFVPGGVFRL